MTVTRPGPGHSEPGLVPGEPAPPDGPGAPARAPLAHRVFGHPIALVAATVAMVAVMAGPYWRNPVSLARTRDPAWYTWRAAAILSDNPQLLLTKQGPFTSFSGGYRVVTPVTGALLNRIAGVDVTTYTKLLMIGLPVLTAMALGAYALRSRRDPFAYLLMAFAALGLFLTIPFIGYLDNVMALFLLATALPFLEPARTSWGARSAVGLMVLLATLSHPTTAAVFVAVLLGALVVRLATVRFSVRRAVAADGPTLLAGLAGFVVGFLAWRLGAWGPGVSFSDAVLTQPYSSAFFRARMSDWWNGLRPGTTWPLIAAAVIWIVVVAVRRRTVDGPARISLLWLPALLGTFGYVLGLTYPYYRFINVTLGPVILAGTGAWALTLVLLWVGRRLGDRWAALQALAAASIVVVIAVTFLDPGVRYVRHQSEWIGRQSRVSMATASAYLEAIGNPTAVFVIHPREDISRAWGLAKQYVDIHLGGLDGAQVGDSYFFIGNVSDLLAGRPTLTGFPVFDRLTTGYWEDTKAGLARAAGEPVLIVVNGFGGLGEGAPPDADIVDLTHRVKLIRGPGFAEPDPEAMVAAKRAGDELAAHLAGPPGILSGKRHTALVALGILLLLVPPGLIARRWFGLRTFADHLALVPGLSLGMTVLAAIVVIAVTRHRFGEAEAWASVALANLVATGLWVVAKRRPREAAPELA